MTDETDCKGCCEIDRPYDEMPCVACKRNDGLTRLVRDRFERGKRGARS